MVNFPFSQLSCIKLLGFCICGDTATSSNKLKKKKNYFPLKMLIDLLALTVFAGSVQLCQKASASLSKEGLSPLKATSVL